MENYCRKMAWLLYNRGLVDKENVEDLRFLLELILTQVITIISVYIIGLLFMDAPVSYTHLTLPTTSRV